MKRLTIICTVFILLSGCGRNKEISNEMYEDTEQVLDILQEAVSDNRESVTSEWDTIIEYEVKYDSKLKDKELNVDEELLEAMMGVAILLHDEDITLTTNDDKLQAKIDDIRYYMKTGKVKE